MIEIRFHGRGGQGVVIASEVLADTAFREGKRVQSFPAFGVERRGAPVMAFTRMDERPIRLRCQIYEPDHIVILDPTLLDVLDVTAGLKEGGWVVLNSADPPDSFGLHDRFRVGTVDANHIAFKYRLGPRNAPIVNTSILGAFARFTGLVGLEPLCQAVHDAVPVRHKENVQAVREAYESAVLLA
ncbi:MAG: 2-oxoacid:acceptor oxidoreductase family protein [Chloroflexia bacterium]|nr:2-oxoacid:acceptor oxidoreductase family protein [Chloroflexia bacterium]